MGELVKLPFWNTLKGGGMEKMGGETKILKRGQAWSSVGCLKMEVAETPLCQKRV